MKQYLLIFAQDHLDFRIPEIKTLVSLLKIKAEFDESSYDGKTPFLHIKFESEESARLLMSRTMLGRSLIELWGHGSSREEAGHMIKSQWEDEWTKFCQEDISICFNVHGFGKQYSKRDKIKIMAEVVKYIPLEGPVKLQDPDQVFYILDYYGLDPNDVPENPYEVHMGRWIADGQRHLAYKYTIKKRHFIGNTSMDPMLALIMANMGNVTPNTMVFDPFVGTGSVLIGAAHFGAYTLGSDINYNVIHGIGKSSRHTCKNQMRGEDENIRTNMRQYGLENHYIDVLVTDFSRNVWRQKPLFDAIITDPPYGLREATKKVGTEKTYKIWEEQIQGHIPATLGYGLGHIFTDLLDFAKQYLRLHGRLVFWLPVASDDYTEDMIPQHPCFKLVANSEQVLSSKVSRRLITMEKIIEDLEGVQAKAVIKDNKYQSYNSLRERVFNQQATETKDAELNSDSQPNEIKDAELSDSHQCQDHDR